MLKNIMQGLAPPKRLPTGAFPPIAPAGPQASQASVGGIQVPSPNAKFVVKHGEH